ncbi:MAG: efflux transporter outer membrane subunit [Burkholderiales bacterium]|nr:efflux transporter outer membrane subunit [Burkholderiales bacterium]
MSRLKMTFMIASLCLCGCANFSGIHSESKPASIAATKFSVDSKWWTIFKDDQLDALIGEALADSPDINIAQARIRLAKGQAALSDAALSPRIDANGSAVRQKISSKGYFPPPLGGSTLNLGQLTLDFDYEFDWWGKNHAALNAALSEAKTSEAEAAETRLILGTAIARSYFRLEADLAKLEILKHIRDRQEALLRLVRLRAQNGIESDFRVRQGESTVAGAKLDILKTEDAIAQGRSRIAALLGKPPERGDAITGRVAPPPPIPTSIAADLIGMRPDILAQRSRIEAASSRVDIAKAEFYPNIDLAAYVGVQSIGFGNLVKGGSEIASIGPAIHLPIFGGGRLRSNLGMKYAEYDIAVEQYNKMVIDAMRDVSQAGVALKSIVNEISEQNKVTDGLLEAHKIALLRYRAGLGDELSVLETETPLLSQRNVKTELDELRLEAVTTMIQSLGGVPTLESAPTQGSAPNSNPG